MEQPIEITIGGAGPYDPAIGATDCLIPSKKGVSLLIEKRNVGYLKASETTPLVAGGFRLAAGTFQAGEIYFVFDSGVQYATSGGTYTNGFNFTQVIAALFGRVGWRQGTITGVPVVSVANLTSRSGRYFDHPLCSVFNVKKLIEDPAADDAKINAYLENLQRSAILRSLNGVLNEPEFLEVDLDFTRTGETNDRAINNGTLFVGRRIRVPALPDIAVQIDSVSLLFDRDVTFPLYLFQEGKKAPLWTGDVTAIAYEKTAVNLPEIILGYLGANTMGGAYFLGYFQEDLGAARAIDETRVCWNAGRNWKVETIQSAKVVGETNFTRTLVAGSPYSHGLTLQLTAFKDWTTYIVKKQNLFDELIGLQVTLQIIELCLLNVRSNPEERILKEQLTQLGLWAQLEGISPGVPDSPKIAGLRETIAREVTRVKKSFYPNYKAINYSGDDCNLN
jgi:hypothetical protein